MDPRSSKFKKCLSHCSEVVWSCLTGATNGPLGDSALLDYWGIHTSFPSTAAAQRRYWRGCLKRHNARFSLVLNFYEWQCFIKERRFPACDREAVFHDLTHSVFLRWDNEVICSDEQSRFSFISRVNAICYMHAAPSKLVFCLWEEKTLSSQGTLLLFFTIHFMCFAV